jgi:ketosteroid isomerase-like protein
MPTTARSFELMLVPGSKKPTRRNELTAALSIQACIFCLEKFLGRFCLSLAGFFLVVSFKGAALTAQAGENEDVKVLLQLENDMARAWVQRDTQTLEQILADDYTLAGTGDALIGKTEYIAGLDNQEFETDSAIVDELRIRVYGDAAVVTGRAAYKGRSKKRGGYVHRFRFTDTFIRHDGIWKCVATHASALAPD